MVVRWSCIFARAWSPRNSLLLRFISVYSISPLAGGDRRLCCDVCLLFGENTMFCFGTINLQLGTSITKYPLPTNPRKVSLIQAEWSAVRNDAIGGQRATAA